MVRSRARRIPRAISHLDMSRLLHKSAVQRLHRRKLIDNLNTDSVLLRICDDDRSARLEVVAVNAPENRWFVTPQISDIMTNSEELREAVAGEFDARLRFALRYQKPIKKFLRELLRREEKQLASDPKTADDKATQVHQRLVGRMYAEFNRPYERKPGRRFRDDLMEWLSEELKGILYPDPDPKPRIDEYDRIMKEHAFEKADRRLKSIEAKRCAFKDVYYRVFHFCETQEEMNAPHQEKKETSALQAMKLSAELGRTVRGIDVSAECFRQWKSLAYNRFGEFLVEEVEKLFEIDEDRELLQKMQDLGWNEYVSKSKSARRRFRLHETDE
jgi:hypothetical protein